MARYLYWAAACHPRRSESLAKKMASTRLDSEGDMLSLGRGPQAGGPLIGDLTLVYVSASHRQAEIGYVFHPEPQGRGLATEAARVLSPGWPFTSSASSGHGLASMPGTVDRLPFSNAWDCAVRPISRRTSGSKASGPTN